MKICILMLFIFSSLYSVSEWDYSVASVQAQRGEWKDAQTKLGTMLVNEPDNEHLLYDAGVAAYRLKEFEKAEAYFESAAQKAKGEKQKKEAHFNLGNTKVALNKLQQAIDEYEEVLKIDPEDIQAKHNRDMVKKMLEEQQQQEQQKQQDQKQNQKNDSDEQKNNEQQSHDGSGQDNKDQSSSKQDSSQQEKKNNENERQSGENDSSNAQEKEEQRADNKKDGEQENNSDNESNNEHPNDKQDELADDHASPSQETNHNQKNKAESQHTKQHEKEQEVQEGEEDQGDFREEQLADIEKQLPKHEQWMARALRKLEEAEEKEQKKMIRAQVQKQSVGHDGQNSW